MQPVSIYVNCPACEGHGRTARPPGRPRTVVCGRCRGKGREASAEGLSILGLLKATGLVELAPEE